MGNAPLPAPAWLFLERTRDRHRDVPLALRAIVMRAENRAPRYARGTRVVMVKRFYGGGYIRPLETIEVRKVGAAIVRRVFS